MANVTATGSFANITVTSTPSTISVTDTESNVIVSNIAGVMTNVAVSSTSTTVNVAPLIAVSNTIVRNALTGGDGITYYPANGSINVNNTVVRTTGDQVIDGSKSFIGEIVNSGQTFLNGVNVLNGNTSLHQYRETVSPDQGSLGNTPAFDLTVGSIFSGTLTGDITGITLESATAGSSATINLTQDAIGGWVIDTTSASFSDWVFVNGESIPQPTIGATSTLNVYYDGSTFYASVLRFDDALNTITINGTTIPLGGSANITPDLSLSNTDQLPQGITNKYYSSTLFNTDFAGKTTTDLTEGTNLYYTEGRFNTAFTAKDTDDLSEGTTNLYYTSARANADVVQHIATIPLSVGGNLNVTGNLDVTGNINYREVEDLLVRDQTITLNYGNATPQDAQIIVDRSGGGGPANVDLKWNEATDRWTFSNNGSTYYNLATSTTDVAEGTNLYFTNARADARVVALRPSTDFLPEGSTNLYFTNARADARAKGALSVTTATPSGDGALTYNNTSGVFTFTPADAGESDYGNVQVANFLANGFGSNTITTTGDITTTGFFEGDLNGAVNIDVYNNTGSTLNKGDAVYLTGGNNGDNPHVALADSDDATKMPALGIVRENITTASVGQVVTSGEMNDSSHGYTLGADLYIDTTAGGLTTTVPTGEDKLIQKIGKVVSANHILVQGAFRTNATPNLNEGNIFLGDTNNAQRTVTPSNNFNTLSNAFDLSNTLTNVNSITTESATALQLNTNNQLTISQTQGAGDVVTYTANINQEGYSVTPSGTLTQTGLLYNLLVATNTGGLDQVTYAFAGTTTAGSNQIAITDGGELRTWRDNGETGGSGFTSAFTTAKAGIGQYRGFQDCYGTSWAQPSVTLAGAFPIGVYVVSVDTVGNTITMSENATKAITYTTTQPFLTPLSAVDTTTGMVTDFFSEYDWDTGAGAKTAISQTGDGVYHTQGVVFRQTGYGYPFTGFTSSDFNWGIGSSSDWTFNLGSGTEQFFLRSRTALDVKQGVFKAPNGMVVGNSTEMSNRGANDPITGFGINVMFDGKDDAITQPADSSNVLPQILFKQYTNNTFQGVAASTISRGGPRLFFTSATGDIDTDVLDQYPRTNQELGRLSFWGSAGDFSIPSSINVPGMINANAHDDWTSVGSVGGNLDMHFAATSNKDNGADVFMSYEAGELVLASGKNSTSADIIFAPAQQSNNGNVVGAYSGTIHSYAKINYDDVSAEKGSKFTLKQGIVAGSSGNLSLSIDREFINTVQTVNLNTAYAAAAIDGFSVSEFNSDAVILLAGGSDSFNAIDADGTQISITGMTGTNSTNLNGGTFYVRTVANSQLDQSAGGWNGGAIELYTDVNATVLASASTLGVSGFNGVGGIATYSLAGGATAKNWELELEKDQDDLKLKADDVTRATFSSGSVAVTLNGSDDASTVFIDDKFNIGNVLNDAQAYSFPKLPGANNTVLVMDANNDLQFEDFGANMDGYFEGLLRKYIGTINFVDGGLGNISGGASTTTSFAQNIDGGNA